MPSEHPPEQQDIRREEHQGPDGDRPLAEARGNTGVDRHENRQRKRDGGVDVDQRVRTVLPQEQRVADRLG